MLLPSSERKNTIGSPYYLTVANKEFGVPCGNKIASALFTIAYLATSGGYDIFTATANYRISGYQNDTPRIVSTVAENYVFAPSKVGPRQSVHQYSVAVLQFGPDIRTVNSKYSEHVSADK